MLNKDETNFLKKLPREQFKHFRKRFTGCILATDMARSNDDLGMFNSLIELHQVKDGANASELIDHTSDVTEFNSKQLLLEHAVHAGDMSVATRQFDVVRKWTYYLYDEFFT